MRGKTTLPSKCRCGACNYQASNCCSGATRTGRIHMNRFGPWLPWPRNQLTGLRTDRGTQLSS
jgi:hypothetical protein